MADSDEPREGESTDGVDLSEAFAEPGPRRSTYTPPPHITPRVPATEQPSAEQPPVEQPPVTAPPVNPPPVTAPPVNPPPVTPPPVTPQAGVYSIDNEPAFNPPPFDDYDDEPVSTAPPVYSLDEPTALPLWAPPSVDEQPFAAPAPTTQQPFLAPPSAADQLPFLPPPFDDERSAPDPTPEAEDPEVLSERLAAQPPPAFPAPAAPTTPAAFEPPAEVPPPAVPTGFPTFSSADSFFAPPPPPFQAPAPEQVVPEPASEPEPEPEPEPVAVDTAPPAPTAFPSPEEQAALLAQHAGPTSAPWIPERRSLTDEELTAELGDAVEQPGSALEALEVLESQLRLRVEEAQEYRDWEDSMLSIGTPEAIATVERVRPQFEEVVAVTTSIPIQYPEPTPVPDAPIASEPVASEPVASEPVAAEPVVAEAVPEPIGAEPIDIPDERPDWYPEGDLVPPPEELDPIDPEQIAPEDYWTPPPLIEPPAPPSAFAEPAPTSFDSVFAAQYGLDTPVSAAPPVEPVAEPAPDIAPLSFVGPVAVEPVAVEPVAVEPVAVEPDDTRPADAEPIVPPSTFSFDALLEPEPDQETATVAPFVVAPPAPVEVLAPAVTEDAVAASPAYVAARAGFTAEEIGALPTPAEQRVGRAVRLFWLWFAANSSVVSVAFGGILFSLGMSLRQAVIATLIGVALSFIPLGLGTLAGKRSSQPTMVVSRATFGVHGNILPALISLVSRVFWGAALLWVLAASVAASLVGANLTAGFSLNKLVILIMGVGFILALLVAFFGFRVIATFQLVISIVSVVLIAGLIWLTWPYVDFGVALTTPDGSITLILTGAVLVFSFIGLVWANSAGDLARYQGPGTSSSGSVLSASFGTTLPTFALIAYGALLAASDPAIAAGLISNPVDTLGRMLPLWYPIPLVAAVALSLLSGVVVTIYSGSFAIAATGVRMKQTVSTLLVAVLVFAVAWVISTVGTDLQGLFRDLATTIAVPVAAWAGIFAAETMIRNRSYHAPSLLTTGGIYPAVRWVNLGALVVVSGIGYGLTTATLTGLGWQGYIFTLAGITGDLAASDLGVLVALLLGLLVPIVAGIPAIRRQEAADSVA